jgi:DNA-binding transcriptional ArsR family regulator
MMVTHWAQCDQFAGAGREAAQRVRRRRAGAPGRPVIPRPCGASAAPLDGGRTASYRHFGMRRNVSTLEEHPDLQEFLKACASETRQKILFLFVDGQARTVGQIAEELDIVPSTASEHLAILRRGGLMDSERDGKETYYRPNRARTLLLLKKLTQLLANCCPG